MLILSQPMVLMRDSQHFEYNTFSKSMQTYIRIFGVDRWAAIAYNTNKKYL